MNSFLIIGAGIEQVRAYELASSMGYHVVGTDWDPEAPAFNLADDRIIASTRDPQDTLNAVIKYCQENPGYPLAGVMTIANDVPVTVATVAEYFGLPSIGIKAAEIAADKMLMKRVFADNNVATALFRPVTEPQDILIAARDWNWPLILKPVDGRGARGVLLLDESMDLQEAWDESMSFSSVGRLMVENFIVGPQISTESMMIKRKCHTAAYADRNYGRLQQFKPYIIEDGGTQPARLTANQRWEINNLVESAALAMGISDGIVKGDIVVGPDGPCVIEIAARLSGGYFATDQIPLATGIDLVALAILHALGSDVTPDMVKPIRDSGVAIRYFFPPEGTIKCVSGLADLSDQPGICKAVLYCNEGDVIPQVKAHPDRSGFIIAMGSGRQEAEARVEKAIKSIVFEME